MKYSHCEECVVKAAWAGVFTSLTLALLKYYIGWFGGSAGVTAAAIHSTICMVSSASILFTHSFAKRGEDERFPYGYGKIEFVASSVVSLSILVVITVFFISNMRALLQELHHVPHVTTAVIAIASIVANESLYRYFHCVGNEMNSVTVKAAAWAVRSDAFTSLAVLIGVIGTSLGIRHLDPVIAIGITLFLFYIVGGHLIHSVRGLMDYSSDEELSLRIKKLIKSVKTITGIRSIRARSMGQIIKVDLELEVESNLTVEEVDKLEEEVAVLIRKHEKRIKDISIGFVTGGN
ncbi:MAG: cation transporter [Deltaproteobacteria bacterium]|nr:cation transporter [Deltaproteobacteria bacterium]